MTDHDDTIHITPTDTSTAPIRDTPGRTPAQQQDRIDKLISEYDLLRRQIVQDNADYNALHQEFLAEREARVQAQTERDRYRELLVRVLSADEDCNGTVYAALIALIKVALREVNHAS